MEGRHRPRLTATAASKKRTTRINRCACHEAALEAPGITGKFSAMRPLRYSINVTLDGCCDDHPICVDEELHRHAVENLSRADALLLAG